MNQENNCCDKCESNPLEHGFTSGTILCKSAICPCHSKNHTRDWKQKLLELERGGETVPWWIYTFTSEILISQKKELVERLESEIKKTQSANASLVNPIPALNDTLEELLAAIKVISEV